MLRQRRRSQHVQGFEQLTAWLKNRHAVDVHICMEATGAYWEALASYLHGLEQLLESISASSSVPSCVNSWFSPTAFFGPASLLMRITLDAEYGIYPTTLRRGHRGTGVIRGPLSAAVTIRARREKRCKIRVFAHILRSAGLARGSCKLCNRVCKKLRVSKTLYGIRVFRYGPRCIDIGDASWLEKATSPPERVRVR